MPQRGRGRNELLRRSTLRSRTRQRRAGSATTTARRRRRAASRGNSASSSTPTATSPTLRSGSHKRVRWGGGWVGSRKTVAGRLRLRTVSGIAFAFISASDIHPLNSNATPMNPAPLPRPYRSLAGTPGRHGGSIALIRLTDQLLRPPQQSNHRQSSITSHMAALIMSAACKDTSPDVFP